MPWFARANANARQPFVNIVPVRWSMFVVGLWLAGSVAADGLTLNEQRNLYRQAVDHLRAGQITAARRIQEQLADYPLAPYITYHRLRLRLANLSAEQVNQFRSEHPDIPGAHRVYHQWLRRLAGGRQWRTYIKHYEPVASDETVATELRCLYLRALYNTGDRQRALDGVAEVWTVGHSQPKVCDPMFQVWQSSRLDQDNAWRRLRLAIAGNQRMLARYLQRFLNGDHRRWGQAYYDLHVNPSSIARTSRFTTDSTLSREVVAHGLRRLAGRDAPAARDAWASYRKSHQFSDAERGDIDAAIGVELAKAGLVERAPSADSSPEHATGFADAYVRHRNWPLLSAWIEQMPDEQRFENKWQYWLARALDMTHESSERARLGFQALATQRDYYGFLAAARIGQEPQLNAKTRNTDAAEVARVRQLPGIARAMELFAVGEEVNANREWLAMLPRLTPDEQGIAIFLAHDMGKTMLAIRSATRTKQLDYLEARFPIRYANLFRWASHLTGIPLSVLVSFARQESVFEAKAHSSANARGVMQMLPSTARYAARRAGMRSPSPQDLYEPDINIPLGSQHIAWLLRRYDQVLPFVAAAYNAGEGRADRWIRELRGAPMDVWIEMIPFRETRNYVKAVLSFNQVYSQMLGQPLPMLRDHETTVPSR